VQNKTITIKCITNVAQVKVFWNESRESVAVMKKVELQEWCKSATLDIQGMDKIMETVVGDTHFFANTELCHHLHEVQLVSFLE
jgi:hypothetical protein